MIGRFIWGLLLIVIGVSIFFPEVWSSEVIKAIIAAALVLTGIRVIFGMDNKKQK